MRALFIGEDSDYCQVIVHAEIVELRLLSWEAVVLVRLFRRRAGAVT